MSDYQNQEIVIAFQIYLSSLLDTEVTWGLMSNNKWATTRSPQTGNSDILLFWSSQPRAELVKSANANLMNFIPTAISLEQLVEIWLPKLADDNAYVGLDVSPNLAGASLPALSLLEAVKQELQM